MQDFEKYGNWAKVLQNAQILGEILDNAVLYFYHFSIKELKNWNFETGSIREIEDKKRALKGGFFRAKVKASRLSLAFTEYKHKGNKLT